MSHTKGKWVENAFGKIVAENPGKQDQTVANVLHYKAPQGEANAHLIAAAPALLETCEGLLKWFDPADSGMEHWTERESLERQAKAAIAAANKS